MSERRKAVTLCREPRHTLREFYEQLGKMLDQYPELEDAIVLEASVDDDHESIYEGAVDLELFRTDIEETGTLTIPVLKPVKCS